MGAAFDGSRGRERLSGMTVAGVLLVPMLLGVLFAWGLASPVEDASRVTAAVVNNDDPVTVNGQTVPLGRELAGGLIGGSGGTGAPLDPGSDPSADTASSGPNFTWVLTNADEAEQGLDDGRYAAVVTIPSTFSANATSISGPAADAQTASVVVTTTPTTAFLDPALTDVIVQAAVSTLNESLTQRYLTNVYQGFNQINSSIAQAADGADQLASGTASLSSGADNLASGAEQLSEGLDTLDSGAQSLSSGLGRLESSVQSLPGQTAQLASGSAEVAAAVDAEAVALGRVTNDVADVVATICDEPGPGRLCDRATALLARLQAADADVRALAVGADEVAVGNRRLAAGIPSLVSGIDASASGAAQLATGADSSAAGGRSLASGADSVASGAAQVDDGAEQLASGLDDAVDQIPTYSDNDIRTLSTVVAQPVQTQVDLPGSGTQSVPLFAVVALWIGGIVVALAHQAVPRSRLLTARSAAALTLRGLGPVLALGAAQGLLVGIPLLPFLDVDAVSRIAFAAMCVVIGTVFAVVNHGLAAALGGVGRTVAVVIAVLALVVGTSSTAPAAIESAAALAPTGPARVVLLAAIGVGSGLAATLVLVVWVLLGYLLAYLGTARERSGAAVLG